MDIERFSDPNPEAQDLHLMTGDRLQGQKTSVILGSMSDDTAADMFRDQTEEVEVLEVRWAGLFRPERISRMLYSTITVPYPPFLLLETTYIRRYFNSQIEVVLEQPSQRGISPPFVENI